ncbi:hypothetical protein [Luteibacter sp. CQ10]|uniref:hypothetical protein n=1 Tax=Luteibacter sp. CQ10 TaxID=2805821 RepID=UPI0034A272BE
MEKKAIFKYGNLLRIIGFLSIVIVAMALYAFMRAIETFREGDEIYFVIGVPLIGAFVAFPLLAYRDVVLSEEGIGRALFGFRMGFTRWDNIVSVRCGVISNKDRTVTSYHLRTKAASPFGGVSVMSMIEDVDALTEAISNEVRNRRIPVFAWEGSVLVELDYLPPPTKGPAAWN